MISYGSRLVWLLMFMLSLASVTAAQTVVPSDIFLGPPPIFPERLDWKLLHKPVRRLQSRLVVDPSDRTNSQNFYLTYYENASRPGIDWTGDGDTCAVGTTAAGFKDAVMLRINYFRAMAGVPANITWSSTYSSKDQNAALMMAVNGSLNHFPPSSWKCYSTEGTEAARNSNLALGANGWAAIDLYMSDPGANNQAVGHRRWLLYPQTQWMGTGDVPPAPAWSANALWVFDEHIGDTRPATRERYVAWPPPGYVPYQVVYPRWSFALPDADFTTASATVSCNGVNVPVTAQSYQTGYGENTLVWLMNNMSTEASWPKPGSDEVCQVTVQNVMVDGSPQSFTYNVTVFDPSQSVYQPPQSSPSGTQGSFDWLFLLLGD